MKFRVCAAPSLARLCRRVKSSERLTADPLIGRVLEVRNRVELPSSKYRARQFSSVAPERDIVRPAEYEPVPRVEERRPMLGI